MRRTPPRRARTPPVEQLDPLIATLVFGYEGIENYSEDDRLTIYLMSECSLYRMWLRRQAEVLAVAESRGVTAAAIAWFDVQKVPYLARCADNDDA